MVSHPCLRCRDSAQHVFVLLLTQQNAICDNEALRSHGYKLLRLSDLETLEIVRAYRREQPRAVRTCNECVGHVMRQIGDRDAVAPRALLLTPANEFWLDYRNLEGLRIGLPKQFDGGPRFIDTIL